MVLITFNLKQQCPARYITPTLIIHCTFPEGHNGPHQNPYYPEYLWFEEHHDESQFIDIQL